MNFQLKGLHNSKFSCLQQVLSSTGFISSTETVRTEYLKVTIRFCPEALELWSYERRLTMTGLMTASKCQFRRPVEFTSSPRQSRCLGISSYNALVSRRGLFKATLTLCDLYFEVGDVV
jgi:hypothetical protein